MIAHFAMIALVFHSIEITQIGIASN